MPVPNGEPALAQETEQVRSAGCSHACGMLCGLAILVSIGVQDLLAQHAFPALSRLTPIAPVAASRWRICAAVTLDVMAGRGGFILLYSGRDGLVWRETRLSRGVS